ncbi:hypothetical protein [Novosphingobium sp.]|uniref:hypothetical protein n=1 Tax=Novosphingobium sp. TaxID=1874826 RepID=UPI001D82DE47|nr:hypothetical protein [Novosphingobium sp.]MBX9662586.1 hypothetical protein [Novosphingobium sp.]
MTDGRHHEDAFEVLHEGWPPEIVEAYWGAFHGLLDGDLRPMAEYLRAGFEVDRNMAVLLAGAFNGDAPVKLVAEKVGQDRRPHSIVLASYQEDLRIGSAVYRMAIWPGKTKWESAVREVAASHGVGRTRAARAYSLVKAHLAGDYSGAPIADMVTLEQELPGEWARLRAKKVGKT